MRVDRPVRLLVVVAAVLVLVAPGAAQMLYNNGPINGDFDAWTINFGFVVSDSFTISSGRSQVTGLVFAAWLMPASGDLLQSAEVSITSSEMGGTTYFDQQLNFTQSSCFTNAYGYNVCDETASFNGPTLDNGTYWLNLSNAVVNTGDPVYWDENSGEHCTSPGCPSMASENSVGSIPSEAFTLLGTPIATTPEPGTLALLASGVLALGGFLRRR